MAEPLRVLVFGGTGVFGERLVTSLLSTTRFDVIIVARDEVRLAASIARHGGGRRLAALTIDIGRVTPDALRGTGAFAVIDAAGPFQGASYRLAEAAIEAGLHVIDLADARDFVAGFSALDAAARAAGVVALTGASTTPALSNAVLDRLTAGWSRVERIDIAISPGNRAPRGLSVIRSILTYAGQRVRVFQGGRWDDRPGWGMTVRRTMPGLGRRWLSLVETPDLDIVPARFAVRDAVIFRAGLEMTVMHLGLCAASVPVRLGLLRSLVPLAALFRRAADRLQPFGSDRGGMTVDVEGFDAEGRPVHGSWSLVAESGHGPDIPTLPAIAALRALADGRIAVPGASACVGVLPLEWLKAEFAGRRIESRMNIERAQSLYEMVLGEAFAQLPGPIRRLHTPGPNFCARGMASVEVPDTWAGRIVSALFHLPRPAEQISVSVTIEARSGCERWVRDFGGRRFSTVLSAGAMPKRLVERFGLVVFDLEVSASRAGIESMQVVGWWLGPIPLPRWLKPESLATETIDAEGCFRFDVEMRLPLGLGRLVRCRGWLVLDDGM